MPDTDGVRKFNKYTAMFVTLAAAIGIVFGSIGWAYLKSAKIDDAYECAKTNEQSIYEMKEVLIRMDENLIFVKAQMEEVKSDIKDMKK